MTSYPLGVSIRTAKPSGYCDVATVICGVILANNESCKGTVPVIDDEIVLLRPNAYRLAVYASRIGVSSVGGTSIVTATFVVESSAISLLLVESTIDSVAVAADSARVTVLDVDSTSVSVAVPFISSAAVLVNVYVFACPYTIQVVLELISNAPVLDTSTVSLVTVVPVTVNELLLLSDLVLEATVVAETVMSELLLLSYTACIEVLLDSNNVPVLGLIAISRSPVDAVIVIVALLLLT